VAVKIWLALLLLLVPAAAVFGRTIPRPAAIDAVVGKVMAKTGARGLALAVIDGGRVRYVQAYGVRNAGGDPLRTDTVMYGASLTKSVFAYTIMQLVDQGRLALDTPLAAYLDKPLPDYDTQAIYPDKYGPYRDLAGDPRWQRITPRMALTHSTGLPNFWWSEPNEKLRIHFEPGTRYSYSGEGLILLQFVVEQGSKAKGLGLDLGQLTQANFDRLGMTRTSLIWRPDFRPNLADGFTDAGKAIPHDERSKVRVAGSMDTTIADLAKFVAALANGDGLSPASHAEMVKPQFHIGTAHQFPNFALELPVAQQRKDLFAGLGLVVFDGPQGRGYFKGGHDEQTGNTMVCLQKGKRCLLLLSNDVRAEAGFAELVGAILGDTGVPFDWEYGDHAGKS
jgi:CubicO group peptidase (beta-lactamase class C family)